jgi:hypothetical protein
VPCPAAVPDASPAFTCIQVPAVAPS